MPTYKQLSTIPRWLKFTVTYSDLAIAGLTNDVEIYSLPANAYISSCQIVPTTLFSGGTIATYTISVGKTGDLTMSCVPRNVFTGAPALPAPGGQSGVQSMSVATSIRAAAISTVGNLDAATAGSANIYLLVGTLP